MWQEIQIDGVAVELYEPPQRLRHGALIYLHAHGEERLSEQAAVAEYIAATQLPVIAPRGGKSWWLDQPSPQFAHALSPLEFIRTHLVQEIEQRWGIQPPQIGLLGVSMGGQGVLNLAYRHGRQFPCVAAISPAIDFHNIYGRGFHIDELFESAEAARQQTVTLHLHPLNWPKHQFFASDPLDRQWHDGVERLASKLISSGIPFESDLTTSQGGHSWKYFNHMLPRAIAFLDESLRSLDGALPRI